MAKIESINDPSGHTVYCTRTIKVEVALLTFLKKCLQDGEEIVKFLQDVLDTLFSLFSTEDGNSTQVLFG